LVKHNKTGEQLPNDQKIYRIENKTYQMVVKYSQWPQNIPAFDIPRPSKVYPKLWKLLFLKYTVWQP
jgi:hypothetical protein